MTNQLQELESLVAEACRDLKKTREQKRKLSAEVLELREQTQGLQVQLREHFALTERHKKVKGRLEKLVESVERLERQDSQ